MEHIELRAKEELLNMDDCMFEDLNEKFLVNFINQEPKIHKNRNSCKNLVAITSRQTKKYLDTENTKERLKNNLKEILETEILSQTPSLSRVSAIPSMKVTKHSNTTPKIPTYCYNERTTRLTDLERLPMFSLLKENNSCLMKKIAPLDAKESNKNKVFEQENSQIRKFIKKKMEQKALEKQQRIFPLANTIENINKFKTLITEKIKTEETVEEISLKKQKNSNGRTSTKRMKQKIKQNGKIENKENLFATPEAISVKKEKESTHESRKLRSILF